MNYNKYISYLYLIFLFYFAERNVPPQFKFLNTNSIFSFRNKKNMIILREDIKIVISIVYFLYFLVNFNKILLLAP